MVLHRRQETSGVTQSGFSIPVTSSMVPGIKILAGFARKDGELVLDMLELQVECQLEHKVHVPQRVPVQDKKKKHNLILFKGITVFQCLLC